MMFNKVLENHKTQELLKEIFNNPKYYDKKVEDSGTNNYVLNERVLILFYDALYKYQLIIEDEKYLIEYLNNIDIILRKLDSVENIKLGISKLLVKLISKKLGLKDLKNEEVQNNILSYMYDRYVKNGYYLYGVSKPDYLDIRNNGLNKFELSKDIIELNDILNKYDINILNDEDKIINIGTNFNVACMNSINSPKYLYNLICNNKCVNNRYHKACYFKKDYEEALTNLNKTLNNLLISEVDSSRVLEIFNELWNYYNNSSDIYLVLVKRDVIKKVEEFTSNKDFDFDEACYNILSSYDDYYNEELNIKASNLEFVELPGYHRYIKKSEKKKEKKIEIVEDDFKFDNKYGKVGILIIIGLLLIIVGVILVLVLI